MKVAQIPPAVLQLEQQIASNRAILTPPLTLVNDMKKLLEDEVSADFTIVTSSDANRSAVVKCHRAVLYARWFYFSMLMSSGMKEATESSIFCPHFTLPLANIALSIRCTYFTIIKSILGRIGRNS